MKSSLLALAALFIALPSYAGYDSASWILSAGTSASIDLQSSTTGTSSVFNGTATVGYALSPHLELAIVSDYLRTSTGGASTASSILELTGELLFLLSGENHSDAFYAGPRAGVSKLAIGSATSNSTLFGGVVGKRINLIGPVSWDPNFAAIFSRTSAGTSSPNYRIVPLQFTLIL